MGNQGPAVYSGGGAGRNMTRPRSGRTIRPPGGLLRGLTFRPLSPGPDSGLYLIRNRYQAFTPIAERFLARVRRNAPA